jgi:hypothetical protein
MPSSCFRSAGVVDTVVDARQYERVPADVMEGLG